MFPMKQTIHTSALLLRAKREVQILEAVINVTTRMDRHLMDLRASYFGVESLVDGFYSEILKIRAEFHRLRRKKGKPE